MKVKELILKLQLMDPDLEIVTPNDDVGYRYFSLESGDIREATARVSEEADDTFERTGENYARAQKIVVIG